jgi:ABC-type nitrate/sulfonate/bicarbonate transport system substrate-binding protein
MVGVAALVLAMAAGCSAGGEESASAPSAPSDADPSSGSVEYPSNSPCPELPAPVELTQPAAYRSAAATWLFVAEDLGLFEQCGINVDIPDVASDVALSMYLAGDLPFAAVGGEFPAAVATTDRDVAVYGLMGLTPVFKFVASPSIKKPEDLKGKVIAVLAPGDSTSKLAEHFLKLNNIDPSEVTFSFVKTIPNIATAVQTGAADAGVLSPPINDVVISRGLVEMYDFSESDVVNPLTPIVGNPEWVAANPEAAKNMLRAIAASVYIVQTQPDIIRESLIKHLELDPGTSEGRLSIESAVEAAPRFYLPLTDMLSVDKKLVELFKKTARADMQPRLVNVDMTTLLPEQNLGQEILEDGFLDHLEKLYGPLP